MHEGRIAFKSARTTNFPPEMGFQVWGFLQSPELATPFSFLCTRDSHLRNAVAYYTEPQVSSVGDKVVSASDSRKKAAALIVQQGQDTGTPSCLRNVGAR